MYRFALLLVFGCDGDINWIDWDKKQVLLNFESFQNTQIQETMGGEKYWR